MNAAIDPWVITQREKLKYQQQFEALLPQNGIVTGAQAKGFFLQSQLPPLTLGQIWALADTDSDGKMNINEFSIACKLINLKLRGFEIPKILPPTLIASLSSSAGTPILTPTGSLSPLDPLKSLGNNVTNIIPTSAPIATIKQQPQMTPLPQTIIPPMPGLPMIPPTAVHGNVVIPPLPGAIPPPNAVPGSVMPPPPGTIPPPNVMPGSIMPPPSGTIPPPVGALPIIPTQPLNSALDNAPPSLIPMSTQPIIPGVQPLVSVPPLIPPGQPLIPGQPPLISSVAAPQQHIVSSAALPTAINATEPVSASPVPPTPPQSNPPSRSVSISERGMPIESPQSEWAIKGPVKLKYTQLFNTTDRTRSGYLTGAQARNIMVQSKLPQAVLAQIWALADMDSDGRLGCEEFVLAMYLCDRALAGEKIPVTLPQDLIPPSFRKIGSRHGSISGSRHTSQPGSRHASISSQGAIDADPAAGLPQTTFEDKRKENFDKGQAELDRRRKLLMEQQRKEQEERERKEREEAEKKEKARLEAERKQQEELERQLQRQREIEMEKEEQRKRALEAKEAARKELERQRQLEWEKQKIQEMQLQKEREQEKVLKLKAQNQTLSIELSTLNEKIKELTQKIVDTRVGVSNVKSIIDGMRTTRDTKMAELAQHKSKIKEQNQKLLHLAQEKSKWDAKMKSGQDEQMNAAFTNKQIAIKQLKDKIENAKEEIETKKNDINSNDIQLEDLKIELSKLITKCEELYADYDTHRNQVLELKHNKKNETYNSTWDTAPSSNAWGDSGTKNDDVIESKIIQTTATVQDSQPAPEGFVKYRAIYEFSARNADEISFEPGDIILVPIEQNAEPGWLAGEINGHTGWFPETYVEKIDTSAASAEDNVINTSNYNTQDTTYNDNKPLEETTETAIEQTISSTINTEISKIDNATYNGDVEYYIAAYPYASTEIGDLNFNAGEMIMVTKKEGDWWTGTIGTRTGMFPSNYVQKADVGGGGSGTGVGVGALDSTTNIEETSYAQDTTIKDAVNGNAQEINETQIQLNETVTTTQKYTVDETKTQEDLDTEVSQINTQSQSKNTEQNQETSSRPMSRTSSMTPGMRARKSEIALVLAPYEAKSEEQLSLQRGQLIMIRKKTDSGWWEGELQAKGQKRKIGWFPASYVKILQGGRNSGRNTPVSGSKIEMTEQIIDKVIALYPYKAQNDDELSFDKDDIISVLGRDEPEWWRGELNGLTGLFPSNYVGPFVSSGNV